MNRLTLEAAAGVYSGTAHDAKPHPIHIERNKAFNAGAEWQRNHVWHRTDEDPEQGKRIFVLFKTGHCSIWNVIEGTPREFEMNGIVYWAYIDDIIPTNFHKTTDKNKDVPKLLKGNWG